MLKLFGGLMVLTLLVAAAEPARADNIAIVKGSFWTSDLSNQMTTAGHTVTEITTYTAASLGAYDAVVHYGNSFTDMGAGRHSRC